MDKNKIRNSFYRSRDIAFDTVYTEKHFKEVLDSIPENLQASSFNDNILRDYVDQLVLQTLVDLLGDDEQNQ